MVSRGTLYFERDFFIARDVADTHMNIIAGKRRIQQTCINNFTYYISRVLFHR